MKTICHLCTKKQRLNNSKRSKAYETAFFSFYRQAEYTPDMLYAFKAEQEAKAAAKKAQAADAGGFGGFGGFGGGGDDDQAATDDKKEVSLRKVELYVMHFI